MGAVAAGLVLVAILLHLGDPLDVGIAVALMSALVLYGAACGLAWLRR